MYPDNGFLLDLEAPSGDEAFVLYCDAVVNKKGYLHLHPAIQAAMIDIEGDYGVYRDKLENGVYPAAFTRNYDDYQLKRWNSNIAARQSLVSEFLVKSFVALLFFCALGFENQLRRKEK